LLWEIEGELESNFLILFLRKKGTVHANEHLLVIINNSTEQMSVKPQPKGQTIGIFLPGLGTTLLQVNLFTIFRKKCAVRERVQINGCYDKMNP